MRTKMANQCLTISQHSMIPHSPSPSLQTLASAISSKRHSLTHLALAYRYVHRLAIFGTKLNRSETPKTHHRIKRYVSAQFPDEEFSKQINELALRFQVSDDVESNRNYDGLESELELELEWQGDMIPASIERKANSVDLPFSLRIIKRKKQCIKEAGESTYCSVKKAFSSMVFIIRELQSYR
ncbi:hypothetical protein HanRHA438_Chr09g0409701 [Helianthus annuus]|uniref:Uncharacterized protein n=1 Tax=Helianthus annuus TaxID=4232 RepID=A0A9K3N980_HELAN|nr:hypothetical protein HanXRQr2_Chr09g0398001 [Helianthus annuus]KAJ0526745.1 hypothetical protein HanHA300_Chr09g0326561 [Helianthus annuus]KAJ0535270.1 hypothetical protein HanIR_Chr09g0428851 [Helianthus annuus]KAJ0543139.1 hypothetical protein HanHA89_Chr09g0347481 [Helianthus annuus]KAJ0708191.1 hypothetical protein HanLR1_Chr09g0326791 [Helianthus annuus]